MNTPAHLIFGAAAFGKAGQPKVTAAAVLGALLPDLSLYLMAGWALYVRRIPARIVFDEYYFSDAWQQVFAIDNSFVVWGALLMLALWRRSGWPVALTGAVLLHLAFDFPLHHDDARRHFWPISDWVFESPLSYWDRRHHGDIIGLLEIALSLVACGWLWMRHQSAMARLLIAIAALSQLLPGIVWAWVFAAN